MYESVLSYGLPAAFALIVSGMLVLLLGGEALIRGASALAAAMKIPSVVVGLTVVAWCTSAPEFAVSMNAAFQGNADISLGNVVGSNICNVCLILGLAALLAPVAVESSMIKREIPLMLLLSLAVFLFPFFNQHWELAEPKGIHYGLLLPWVGGLFLGILLLYTVWTIYEVVRNQKNNAKLAEEIRENVPPKKGIFFSVLLLAVGVLMLVLGSDAMVAGSIEVAKKLGVSELIIGLTIVAVGTSLPELIVSIMAAFQGKSEIAVGNVIGSNIFNITGVLGPSVLLSAWSKDGLHVSARALYVDMPMMIFVSVCCLVICFTGRRVSRSEGLFLLLCYAAYLAALCIMEQRPVVS